MHTAVESSIYRQARADAVGGARGAGDDGALLLECNYFSTGAGPRPRLGDVKRERIRSLKAQLRREQRIAVLQPASWKRWRDCLETLSNAHPEEAFLRALLRAGDATHGTPAMELERAAGGGAAVARLVERFDVEPFSDFSAK